MYVQCTLKKSKDLVHKQRNEVHIKFFNFDVPSRTSPICCSRGYPGGWIWIFITKLVYKYHMEIYRKSYEYCFIKGEILNFLTFGKKKKKDKEN